MHDSSKWEYWDGVHVHWVVDVAQGDQDAEMACTKVLSTWAKPGHGKLHGNAYGTQASPELDLGYTFDSLSVTCPECIDWMEKKLNRCIGCKRVTEYTYCRECAYVAIEIDEQIDRISGRRKPK